jgi:hypothetical protein
MEPTSTGVQKWLNVVSTYDNEFKKWEARTTKIVKRYRDDNRSQHTNETAKFNILWSNVQTLIPAVYAKLPSADVSRRFGDNDPVSRVASLLIERAIDFEIEHYPDFRSTMRYSVEDRFLGGRGVAWWGGEPPFCRRPSSSWARWRGESGGAVIGEPLAEIEGEGSGEGGVKD